MNLSEELVSTVLNAYFGEIEAAHVSGQGDLGAISVDRYFAQLFYKNGLRFTVTTTGIMEVGPGLYGVLGLSSGEAGDLERLGAMFQGICIACEAIAGEEGRKIAMRSIFQRFGKEWSRAAKERGLPESEVPSLEPPRASEDAAATSRTKSL